MRQHIFYCCYFLVHNIPGGDLTKGDHIVEYSPKYEHERSEGIKRFVVLIYKQKNHLDVSGLSYFDAETLRTKLDSRGDLHVKTVASYQELGKPVAGNFFYVDWDHTKGKIDDFSFLFTYSH